MAYGEKYIFRFDSLEGKDWMVVISEDGYTGDPVSRCVGGHPTLRMESNGCIRGMSLELPAECVVADEFADLYTSDPVRFKVTVYLDSDEVWHGFITPELYSAPWVDPPHDVALTATDGLGELKRQNYAGGGRMSLATHLGNLLAATGLSFPIRMVSSLESDVNDPGDFLSGTLINLDHLVGETMYDALQTILTSIHATVRQYGGSWLLIRETDISGSSAGSDVDDTDGVPIPVVPFGSMNSFDVWPVGRLSSEIVPARNSVAVTSDNESDREFLADPDMTEGSWDGDATHSSDDGGYYQIAEGESISQEVSMPEMPSTTVEVPDMRLSVTARQADTTRAHNIRIKVSSYMYLAVSDTHETYWLSENSSGELVWTDVEGYLERELPAAAVSRSTDCSVIEMVIPVTRHSQRDERKIPETVTVEFASDDNTVYVHSASLGIIPPWAGIETRVTIDNGARGGDNPVGVMFADTEAYNRGLTWMSNCAYGSDTDIVPIHTLASGSITAAGTGVFLAQDYAMSVANPRLSLKGILQIPSGVSIPVFLSTGGIAFLAEEWSYDLLTDELDVSMISLPAVEIEVDDVTQESYSDKGGGGARAAASSGGSAPAPSPARAIDWFIAETYEEDGVTKQRLKLNPKYQGMYAEGWVSAGGLSDGGGGAVGDYLPLAGGDMTGSIRMIVGSSATYQKAYAFGHGSGSFTYDGYLTGDSGGNAWLYGRSEANIMAGYGSDKGWLRVTKTDVLFNGTSLLGSQYVLPAATSQALGGIKLGYTQSGKNYPVQLDSNNRAYVNVPWSSGSGGSTVKVTLDRTSGDKVAVITVDGVPYQLYSRAYDLSSYVTASALATALSGYLPLAGGTMTGAGALNMKCSGTTFTTASSFRFVDASGNGMASIRGTNNGYMALYTNAEIQFFPYNTRTFVLNASALYPYTAGTITLSSSGALSSLGNGYDLGTSSKYVRALYGKVIYLASGVYIYYDTVHHCIRTNAPIVSDSYISAGGVSTT